MDRQAWSVVKLGLRELVRAFRRGQPACVTDRPVDVVLHEFPRNCRVLSRVSDAHDLNQHSDKRLIPLGGNKELGY